jgi:hypothetical protein
MGRHCREFVGQFLPVAIADPNAADIGQHLHHSPADVGERHVRVGDRQSRGIQDQVREPQPHRAFVAEDALECRRHGLEIEERLVDVENDVRQASHRVNAVTRGDDARAKHIRPSCKNVIAIWVISWLMAGATQRRMSAGSG